MAATLPEWTKGANLNDWAADNGGLQHIYNIIGKMSNAALQRLLEEQAYPKRLLKYAKETLASRGVAEQAVEEVAPATAKMEATEGKVGYVREKIRRAKARREAAGEAPPARTPERAPAKAPSKARKEPAAGVSFGGKDVKELSKAKLYDIVESQNIMESARKAAAAELKRRGKPATRPTGAMREVIKGRVPRDVQAEQEARGGISAEQEAQTQDDLIARLKSMLAEAEAQRAGAEPAAAPAPAPAPAAKPSRLTSMGGAELRDLADSGDQDALAEIERRAAKRQAAGKPPLGGARGTEERLKGTAEDTRRYVMEGEKGIEPKPTQHVYPYVNEEDVSQTVDWRGLDELGAYSHKPGQVVYGKLNGEWVHIIPIIEREDGSVDVKMAGQGENAEHFRISPGDDFRFIPPVENESGQEPTRGQKARETDQYNPPMTEGDRLLREESIRARQEEPLTREAELGMEPTITPETARTERTTRLQGEQRDLVERQTQLIREMKRRGWADEDIQAMFRSSRREEEDVFNRNRMQRRQERAGYSDAVEDYNSWKALSPNMPPSTLDQVWRSALERAGWMGRTIPPRPDEAKGGQVSQMTALPNEPFSSPASRLVPSRVTGFPADERDIGRRADEVSMEETGSPLWSDVSREALIERLMAARGPTAQEDVALGEAPFSNFAPLPEGEQGLGGTALPGMAPGERARLKGLVEGGGAPAPARLERQLPGFAAGAEPSVVPPTTAAPEAGTPFMDFSGGLMSDINQFNPVEMLGNLLAGGGGSPAIPAVPVPGGGMPVPAVAGVGGMGLDQMMMEALRDPANRPIYGMTSQGPMPMNTQGGMEDAGRALGMLIGLLLPGYQQSLEG